MPPARPVPAWRNPRVPTPARRYHDSVPRRAWVTVSSAMALSLAASCGFYTNGLGSGGGPTTSSAASSGVSSSSGAGGAPFSQPTCADGVQNGLETDVDCGGDACPPCQLGRACNDGADCVSGTCTGGHCAPTSIMCEPVMAGSPSCGDCVKDGMETDVDCGGDACPPCALAHACAIDADCATGHVPGRRVRRRSPLVRDRGPRQPELRRLREGRDGDRRRLRRRRLPPVRARPRLRRRRRLRGG